MSGFRDELTDEISGFPIGSGYYSTSVATGEARDIADAILAAFPWLEDPYVWDVEYAHTDGGKRVKRYVTQWVRA